jgi:hypothetical protein
MPLNKPLYSIEYVDEDGDLEIKKAFLTDEEYRALVIGIRKHKTDVRIYRLSPGPAPGLDGPAPAVLSEHGRELLGLPDPRDH